MISYVTNSNLNKFYNKRKVWCRKGDFGKLIVVGGSLDYSGSPILNSLAAYKSGCDLVRIYSPESSANAIKSYSPDLIAFPLKGDYLSKEHINYILSEQDKFDAIVIGGGIFRNNQTISAMKDLINKIRLPAVLDADALYSLNSKLNKNFILTPHAMEFYKITGIKVENDLNSRIEEVKKAAKKYNCIILLKGKIDVISNGNETVINKTGSNYMTKAGMGDTLAGICGALLARKINSFDAACCAAYINGKAGEYASKEFGESIVASDIINNIYRVINGVKK